jgi:CheY-like chemotaxis protein
VDADAARLAQMIGNLASNALKFTQPGGLVQVAIRTRAQACEISVRDTGMGVAPLDLQRIFEPFVQAERPHPETLSGLGIGPALVKDLATRHGGSIRAESDGLGKGAEFVLTLPIAAAPTATASKFEAGPSTSSLSVLVVEDNEDAGLSQAELIGLNGHQVEVVGTGRAGIESVLHHPSDVLICDVGLPDLNGYEVVRSRRSAGSKVFAIALTGFARPQDRDQAMEAGFNAHLAKPPPLDDLDELLAEAARRKG